MTSYFSEDGPVQLGSLVIGQIQSTGTENGGSKCLTAAKLATGKPRESDQFQYGPLAQQAWNISVSFCGGAANDCIVWRTADLCLESSGRPSMDSGTQLAINKCSGTARQDWCTGLGRGSFRLPA